MSIYSELVQAQLIRNALHLHLHLPLEITLLIQTLSPLFTGEDNLNLLSQILV